MAGNWVRDLGGRPQYHLALWNLQPHWPYFGHMSPCGSMMKMCGTCCKPWRPQGLWVIGSYNHIVHPNCLLFVDANMLLSLMHNPFTSQSIWAIWHANGNASKIWKQYHPWYTARRLWWSSSHAQQYVRDLQRFPLDSYPNISQRQHMSFTFILHQNNMMNDNVCTESWEAMLAMQRSLLGVVPSF